MDLSWLKDRCWEAKTKYASTTVFIDHLHYIVDMATRNNMSLEIGQTMRTLKREIALGLNMAVFHKMRYSLFAACGRLAPAEDGDAQGGVARSG